MEVDHGRSFDDCPVRNDPNCGIVHLAQVTGRPFRVASGSERTLSLGVHLTVSTAQRGQEQHSAFNAFGIAHRRNSDVHLHTRLGKGWQLRGNHDGSDVLYNRGSGWNLHTHAGEHVCESLHCEISLLTISRPLKSNNKAVTNELILANTLNLCDIANVNFTKSRAGIESHKEGQGNGEAHREVTANFPAIMHSSEPEEP